MHLLDGLTNESLKRLVTASQSNSQRRQCNKKLDSMYGLFSMIPYQFRKKIKINIYIYIQHFPFSISSKPRMKVKNLSLSTTIFNSEHQDSKLWYSLPTTQNFHSFHGSLTCLQWKKQLPTFLLWHAHLVAQLKPKFYIPSQIYQSICPME